MASDSDTIIRILIQKSAIKQVSWHKNVLNSKLLTRCGKQKGREMLKALVSIMKPNSFILGSPSSC